MKYSFTCPSDNDVMMVEAMNDNDAVEKLAIEAAKHVKARHPNMPSQTQRQVKDMIRSKLKKH